jgi:hypothetical protein
MDLIPAESLAFAVASSYVLAQGGTADQGEVKVALGRGAD